MEEESISAQLRAMLRGWTNRGAWKRACRRANFRRPISTAKFMAGADVRVGLINDICKVLGCRLETGAEWTGAPLSGQVREMVQGCGMTPFRLAKIAGVDCGSIYRFVNGQRRNPHISTIDKLCQVLCCRLTAQAK